ncbi:MAG: adenylate/guanylate cyclase domain-containing protein [Solirubrobacterales bacterium]|nr:adenylate/guanylate cyclase domain-containing protein [Solirubrobacterales bacterium]
MAGTLTWMYRKLGPRYPFAYIAIELQSAFLISAGVVALFSFYYDADKGVFLQMLVVTLGLTALSIAFVLVRVHRRMRPLVRWIEGERDQDQTAAAWYSAVSLPLKLIKRDLPFPIFGVVIPASLFAVAQLNLSPLATLPLVAGGLIAIGYSGVLHYLAIEFAMRPILFDINAALDSPLRIDRPAIPLRWKLLASLPLLNVISGMTVAALTSNGGGARNLSFDVLVALAVGFAISFELVWLLARSILRPVEDLEGATERIRQGRFDEYVPVTTADEFGELSSAFNQMVDGLAERERLREAFGAYLDEEVAHHIISEDYDPTGAEVEVSILVCDVYDFTTIAAEAEAPEVVARLNELFEVLVPIIARHRGHVDQFIGDAVLGVFGAPRRMTDHADHAVQCAVEIARTVNSRKPGGFRVGIGVNTGKVVAGSVGGAGRLSFSVIGDAVNVASRVEAKTRETGDPVLITEMTRSQLSETLEVKPRGRQELKGYDHPVELYAPVVPVAVTPGEPGEGIAETIGTPLRGPLGAPAGDPYGRAQGLGLGR